MKVVSRLILGWFLLVAGIAGLFLPIIQGIPLLIIGLYLLSRHYTWAHNLFNKFRRKFPTLAKRFDKMKRNNLIHKLFRRKKI